ncbi:MAG: phosphatidylglycerophosphatase A [Campylobacterales bacterium]|nr:phosphatidylglycerophosphatase A [Campylobacterales bacterium]
MDLQKLLLTFFGTGLSPKAPGTVGSFAALIVAIPVIYFLGIESLSMLTLAITIIGIFEINRYENKVKEHDAQEIVIDEVAGMWLTLIIAYPIGVGVGYDFGVILSFVLSFLAFRLFDIWKPSTIGWIDRKVEGGLGVMGDDILAGLAGGLLAGIILIGLDKLI